jgi:hypothetical protein
MARDALAFTPPLLSAVRYLPAVVTMATTGPSALSSITLNCVEASICLRDAASDVRAPRTLRCVALKSQR